MHKSILMPTDGSEFCERAIKYGVAVAKLSGAKIVGVTVTPPLHTATPQIMIPSQLAGLIQAESNKIAAQKLAVIEREAKAAGLAVECIHARSDHPWEAIVKTAKDKGCDLIVMASHGRRGAAAMLLGSETQKVLTHSSVPVLVVR